MNYADRYLSELAISIPMVTELFRKKRLDFCCGGKQTLKEACEKKNIPLALIIEELKQFEAVETKVSEIPYVEMPKFIVKRYHDDLRRRLPELILLAAKVERVHSDHVDCPHGLESFLKNFSQEMIFHMMKEENVLFPMIESGRGNMANMPVKVMTSEHDSHGKQLEELHRISNDFIPPKDACATWSSLYAGLEILEKELMEHIHLENNILFPWALTQGV
jgi:regulator of cell morphogenesis and NO signaling